MIVGVSNVLILLGSVDVVVVLDVVHGPDLNGLNGLLRKGKYWGELVIGSDGVKSRKKTGVARQQGREVFLIGAA